MSNYTILFVVVALGLTGCSNDSTAIVPSIAMEQPERATLSSYRQSVTASNIAENNATFYATGIVTEIGEEQWYKIVDAVTGNETAAIYYRDLKIRVTTNQGEIGEYFNLMVGSDFEPSIDLSRIAVGDPLVVAGYQGFERNGVIDHGAAYVGLIDVKQKIVHSLFSGDQSEIPMNTVMSAFGL